MEDEPRMLSKPKYQPLPCEKVWVPQELLSENRCFLFKKIGSLRPAAKRGRLFFVFFRRASERRILLIVGVCFYIFKHLHIFSSYIFSSSNLLIFTPSHLHIFSSSHLLILTSSHLLSSHLFILASSHLLIFTPSHLHIFSSSHLLIFTSSQLTSFYLRTFTSFHPHTFSSSHLHIFSLLPSSPLALLLSCPLALLLSCSLALLPSCPLALLPSCPPALFSFLLFYFSLKVGVSANEAPRNATLSHETRFDCQKPK